MAESISTRCAKLNQILSSKNGGRKGANVMSKEALLDAFLVLFEECKTEDLLQDKNISSFVKKYSPMVEELKKLLLKKDDFEVINIIGRGHFGQVQVVKDKHSGDVYAMKTLKKSKTLAQESVAFYEEEREIMASANNPWITSLQYAFQDSHCLYFVMEYQPGGDLLSLLDKYDDLFEEEMARFYLAEITMAIYSLHQLGFVHRDVKPDNVLIDRTGHIKLADFGSSARLSSDRKVYSKMPVGTPEYISPEVLMSMDGSGGPYGVECDWWSLGVVAFEMLCGQTPFEADSLVITYSKILDYKSSLVFPNGLKISKQAKDLITSLCTGSPNRLGYEGIGCHSFFRDIEWEKLQRTVPPFVPTLEGTDDTSNFDDFLPESPDPSDQLPRCRQMGFGGRDLPFVGFSFIKNINTPLSPSCFQNSPSSKVHQSNNLERRLTMKTKELKDALNNCHVLSTEKEGMTKSLEELQSGLSEKEKALRKTENERDFLEKEKVLMDSQIKDLQIRLDSERTERNNSDCKTLQLITEIKQNSRKVEEMRDQETRATFEDQQHLISELEQERFITNKRAHRLEEELKVREKVIEESKHRINDLHSRMSKMNEEAKRSMEDWQSKLDKVTEDSQSCINELQDKLNKALKSSQEATSLLENIRKAKDNLQKELSAMKAEKENAKEDETDGIKPTVRRSDSVVSTIRREELAQQIVTRIMACGNHSKSDRNKEKAVEHRKMSSRIMELEDQLFKNQRELKKLEREVANKQTIEEKLQAKDNEVTQLNRYKRQLEATNKKLEDDLANKQNSLLATETKIQTLQARCQAADSTSANMATTLTEEHKVVINQLKQQKQTSEKELKEQLKKDESLLDKIRSTEDKLFEAQNERTDLQKTNKSLEEAVLKLENEIDEKLLRQEMKAASLKAFDDLEIQERAEIGLELQSELQQMAKHCESIEAEKKDLEKKLNDLNDEYTKVDGTREKMDNDLKEKQRHIESQELTFSMLKSTCTMLESQVEELEIMLESYEEKEMKWDITRKALQTNHDAQECSTAELKRSIEKEKAELKRSIEKEKAARSLAEEKLVKSKEGLDELNQKLERQRKRTEELTELLSESEKKHGIMTVELKARERKLQLEVESNNTYKIENERLESQLSNLRAANFQMNQNIESAMEKYGEANNERATLAEQIEIMETSYAEERLKLEATKAQQTKLIDFLQYKTEGQNNKKRKLIGGGGKTWRKKQHRDECNVVPKQWKDMQQALEKERASSLKLQTELNRTKAELQAAKMEVTEWKSQCHNSGDKKPAQKVAVLSALQQSPSNQQAPLETLKNNNPASKPPLSTDPKVHRPKERMHHNIPHRFVNALNMHPVKCAVCLDTVHFGRQSSKCAECGSICHPKCATHLPHTCGLPSQFVEHFSEALNDNNPDSPIKGMARSVSQLTAGLENWMKVPSGSVKYGWERKWVMLRDNKIHLFDKENVKDKSSPSETLNLDGTYGHVTIHSSVMSSELLGAAPTDLPYILRIESRPKCWPVQNLYLMAPSFSDKQKWVAALEATLAEVKKVTKDKSDKSDEKLFGNRHLCLENSNKIDMNCTQLLSDELLLIGAEEGLYALSLTKPGHGTHREIPGIGKVFQISIMTDLNLAIMIAGKERNLCSVDLKQLQSRARQVNSEVPLTPLTIVTIEKIKNCHLFAIGQFDGSQFICAATPNKLHLLRYNTGMNAFCTRKEVDTSDPCNCIHFTNSSVVYGTGKFYSLDLRQHTIKECLDAADTSLAFAVYGAAQLNIFPIAVLDVTSGGSADQELLLCYNEFGVFVNSAGRQTRQKTLMWTRLPLAFAYKEPFLFVTHFNSIDVCEIPPASSSSTNSFTHKFLDIQNPRVLGPAVSPGAVYIVSSMQEQVELLCFQGSSAAASSCQSDEDLSDFSQLSEMLRTISATSLASEVCSSKQGNDNQTPVSPAVNTKKRRSSFLTNGPFRTPSMKKRKCYEVNPK